MRNTRGVRDGTPIRRESLCTTCRFAQNMRGFSESEVLTVCRALWEVWVVPFAISECSAYDDKRIPEKNDMEAIALAVVAEKAAKRAGFVEAERNGKTGTPKTDYEP